MDVVEVYLAGSYNCLVLRELLTLAVSQSPRLRSEATSHFSPLGVVRLGQCDPQNSCMSTGTNVQCSILSCSFDDGGSGSQGVQHRRACPSDSNFYLLWSLIEDLIDISEKEVEGRRYDPLLCKGDCYG